MSCLSNDAILERAGVVDYLALSPDQKKVLIDASVSRLANFHAPSLSTRSFLSDVSDALKTLLDQDPESQLPIPPSSSSPEPVQIVRRFDELPPDVIVSGILAHVQVFAASRLLSALSRKWSPGESESFPYPSFSSADRDDVDSQIYAWFADRPPQKGGGTTAPGFSFGGEASYPNADEETEGGDGDGGELISKGFSRFGSDETSPETVDFFSSAFAPPAPTNQASTSLASVFSAASSSTRFPSWGSGPDQPSWGPGSGIGSQLHRQFMGSSLEIQLGYCVERDPTLSLRPHFDSSIVWDSIETIPKNSPSCSLFGYFVRDRFRYPWFLYRCVDMLDSEVRVERFLVIRPKTVERLKFVSHLRPSSFPEMPLLRSLEIDLSSGDRFCCDSFRDVESLVVNVCGHHVVDVGNWRGKCLEWRRGKGMLIHDGTLPMCCPSVLLSDGVDHLRSLHLERVALGHVVRLRNLRTLSLQDYSVAMGVDEFFSKQAFENLESLVLTRVNCSFIRGDFRRLKNLALLGTCRVSEDTFRKNAFPSLERFKMVGQSPNMTGDGWAAMPSLKELVLFVHRPKLLDSLLQRENRLVTVKLPGCSMDNCSDWRLKTVTTLLLDSGASKAPSCAHLLCEFPIRLQDLRLHGTLCGEFAETFLSEVDTGELRHLIVERTNFDDRGSIDRVEPWMVCQDLRGQSWPDMPHLRTLKIRHCPEFGDSPFLKHDLPSLRVLDLRGCGRVSDSPVIHRSASAIFRTELSAQVRRMLIPLSDFAPNPPQLLTNSSNAPLDLVLLDGGVDLRRSENILRREQEIRQRPLVFMSEALRSLRTIDSLRVKKKRNPSPSTFQDHWEREFSQE